ncbi:MAG: PCRF domain-containing protein, partial [Aquabacterium sp.]
MQLAPALASSLDRLARRLQELDAALSDPAIAADNRRFRELSREHAELSDICELARRHAQREADLATARQMLDEADGGAADAANAELRGMAQEEIAAAEADLDALVAQLQTALLPRNPDDARPAFVEIRAGTGGDESALFAADLARMYTRFAERRGWASEVMSASASDLGGYKEVVIRIAGPQAYGQLKFESGGHRVQRVPVTETQGRIHT